MESCQNDGLWFLHLTSDPKGDRNFVNKLYVSYRHKPKIDSSSYKFIQAKQPLHDIVDKPLYEL